MLSNLQEQGYFLKIYFGTEIRRLENYFQFPKPSIKLYSLSFGGRHPDRSHGWMSDGVGKIFKRHCRSFVTVFVRSGLDSMILN